MLLADERTGALDTDGGADVLQLFRRLNDAGQTIVMVTMTCAIAAAASRTVAIAATADDRRRTPIGSASA